MTLPYTQDLVRVATSALLAIEESRLTLSARRACKSLLEGYAEALRKGGGAAVLAERYRWLRDLADRAPEGPAALLGAHAALRSAPVACGGAARRLLLRRCRRTRARYASCTARPASAASAGCAWWRSVAGTAP